MTTEKVMNGSQRIIAYVEKHGGVKNVGAAAKACGLTANSFRVALSKLRRDGVLEYPRGDYTTIKIGSSKASLKAEANAARSAPAHRKAARRSKPPRAVGAEDERIVIRRGDLTGLVGALNALDESVSQVRAILGGLAGSPTVNELLARALGASFGNPTSPRPARSRLARLAESTPRAAEEETDEPTTEREDDEDGADSEDERDDEGEEEQADEKPVNLFRAESKAGENLGEYLAMDAALRAFTRSSGVHQIVQIADGKVLRTRAPMPRRGAA